MKKLLVAILLYSMAVSLAAQSSPKLKIPPAAVLDRSIPELLESADIPGLSIAIIQDDRIVYERAFGLRSVDTGGPVTDQTIFSAASLSKALFAYGLMKWVEQGRFDLDRPLHEYFPYDDLTHDDRYQQLTARQVLSHTTGLPNWRRGGQLNFVRDPGQSFGYSGEGFVYLMRVVEHLSGQSINEFMEEQVFTPLGMDRSSYIWEQDFDSDFAIPHDQFKITRTPPRPQEGNTAYSLQTTAVDYSKFLRAMLNAEGLKAGTVKDMLTSQVNVEDDGSVQWGLGVGLQTSPDGKAFWHWGDNGPFKAFFIAYPKQRIGLVYFANSSNGLGIARELLEHAIGGSYPSVNWIDYEGPNAPARKLLAHILNSEPSAADWPYMAANGLHQDTQQIAQSPMNRLGYNLLNLHRPEAALRVFAMNARAFPQSANVHDSYGEALLRKGDLAGAAAAYERAARLDPENSTAKTIVYQIREGNKKGNTTFRLPAYPNARSVQLVGSFNNWNSLSHPMSRENGQWIGRVDLEPGTYEYKFIVDGVWLADPWNPETHYEEGHRSVLKKE
ncbi:serine hydrolase [Flavilitoribacter nigricans]|uniref:Uncharacterized protein n=1 Tax=Flavilitoribacter nigricans (strain ATCC 23147 / DSM 23189 / NBRC 102662 / NCIMB 1420 / SS-2) TaxID=1122177 RepID=A0A2D0NEG9_FLAN2|nr:serine hydrolase [Flavilitoribacter nigricans]PHN06892.1 hypothetical protein CRP01_09230 [Flavilitoribacter nigricans DSM 23189 = NBRC 102662]